MNKTSFFTLHKYRNETSGSLIPSREAGAFRGNFAFWEEMNLDSCKAQMIPR